MSEYKNFSNQYLDDINENYMIPVFDKLITNYKIGQQILDVGCGNGLFGHYFKTKNNTITGVDASEYALNSAENRGYNEIHLVSDFCSEQLPFKDDSYDFVICKDVMEHLLDPVFLLKEIKRVVKKDGLVFINVPNHFSFFYRIKFLFTNNIDTQNFFPSSHEWDYPHIRFFTFEGIKELCLSQGFEYITHYSNHFTSYIPKTHIVPPIRKLQDNLAYRYPSQFSVAFPLLFKK
jgi:2-polyprenyl-3-methyl-5-hydroxy-6-metoxy-1,4-benzoquinol methylase